MTFRNAARAVCTALLLTVASTSTHASDISLFFLENDLAYDLDPLQAPSSADTDLWARIRHGFAIPDLDNPLVANHTTWYSARPQHMDRTTARAARYLYHVVEELEKRNMPTELALLPFIESAFDPQARSSAKAAGMWQFMPATGRAFKLQQNLFRDERLSVLASTDAALTYLERLHGMFGDWHLALAAYNWGEGSVRRAIKKAEAAGKPTDFNGLSEYMPAETRNYVPKLQALKNVVTTPTDYGIALVRVENRPYFVTIDRTRDIDVKLAASLAELPMEEFQALNPQFNRPVITGGPGTRILLPSSNAEKFKSNLAKWTRNLSSWTAHKVTNARERIETLAKKFKTTPEIIRQVNNIPAKMQLRAGSTVLVPRLSDGGHKDITLEVANSAALIMEPDTPKRKSVSHKVGKNETLSSIAARHNVNVSEIKRWNKLRSDTIRRGQKLVLHTR